MLLLKCDKPDHTSRFIYYRKIWKKNIFACDVVSSFYHKKDHLFKFHLYTHMKWSCRIKMYSRVVFRDDILYWKQYHSFFVPT
jgi:hypothetical protein